MRLRFIILALFCLSAAAQESVKVIDTLDTLLGRTPSKLGTWRTVGRSAANDGGAAEYWYDPTSTTATNTTTVFKPNNTDGRWFRITNPGNGTDKLDSTNGVAVALSGTVSDGFRPDSKGSRSWGTDAPYLYSTGDSFTFGASASSYANGYVQKLAVSLGLPATNVANGSFTISDATWATFSGWTVTNTMGPSSLPFSSPSTITEDQNWTALVGFNDLRTSSTSASMYRKGLDHLIHWLAIPGSAKRTAQAPDASTGTWTAIPWSNGMGSIGAYSSSGTLTFSNVIGNDIFVAYLGWGTNYGGTIAVSIDGSSITNFSTASVAYGNRTYINGTDANIPAHTGPYGNGKIDFCPQIIRATDLGTGAHTVVVTASSNPVYVLWCAGNGFSRTIRKGPNVFVGTIPRQSPWTGSGTDALHASYNLQLQQSVATAKASGLRVALAPVANDYVPSTMQHADGVHPTDAGHTAIAAAFEKPFATDIPSISSSIAIASSSSGASGAGSFTTLAVSGNSTLSSRLLVLPTAISTPGGYNSRFGYGSTAASTMSFQYGDSTSDRSLNFVGNGIGSTVNSTGAGADLFLGTSGLNVNVQGNFIVQGTGSYSGIQTINNRLLVLPTLASGGTSHRFGSGLVSGSSVIVNASDSDLDRTLTITGNGISSSVNSTASPADMFIGTSGQLLGVLGNETVAGTLGVSGITTLNNRLLVTPTATNGGFTHRFGSGSVAASSMSFIASDTALDRSLNFVGNGISSTVNSTGAGANLGLGSSGFATAVQGTLTVAEATTLTGALTANGGVSYAKTFTGSSGTENVESIAYTVNQTGTASSRAINIALTSTAAGSGTHRFISASDDGTDVFYVQTDGRMIINSPNGTSGVLFRGQGATDSQISLQHAATLDRRLTLTGNQLYVRDASGSTPNTLALGESTSTVAIQGNETVAGTTIIGTTGTTTGSVGLKGSTSGTVTLSVAAAAGTHTIKLPTADGTVGQVPQTDGAGQWSWTTPGNPTFVDAAADTTTWIALGTSQTGTVAPATDAGLTFNASNNYITCSGGFLGSGDISLGSGNQFYWQSRALMKSPSDGVLTIYNNAATDFTRLQLGGTTTSFPAFGRSSTTIAVQLADGTAGGKLSVGTTQAKVGGTIDQKYTSTGTPASSTETDLHTFTTVSSSLGADGDGFTMTSGGTFAGNASATSQLRVYFGGTQIFATGALTAAAAGSWHIECEIIRSSSTTVRCITKFTTANAVTTPLVTQTDLTGLTLSNANILKVTGQGGGASPAANDIVYKLGRIRFEPAY